MIIDNINNISHYKDLKIFSILKYIANTNLNKQELGKYTLDKDNLFYTISQFSTKEYNEAIWESHYRYTDIHVVLEGEEIIALQDISKLTKKEEHTEKDLIIYSAPILNPFCLSKDMFAVLFTNNGHMPNLMVNNHKKIIKKAVFKVDLANFNF